MFELLRISTHDFSWGTVTFDAMTIIALTRFLVEMCIDVTLKSSLNKNNKENICCVSLRLGTSVK